MSETNKIRINYLNRYYDIEKGEAYRRIKECGIPIYNELRNNKRVNKYIDKKYIIYLGQNVPLQKLRDSIYRWLENVYFGDEKLLIEFEKILYSMSFHELLKYSIKKDII